MYDSYNVVQYPLCYANFGQPPGGVHEEFNTEPGLAGLSTQVVNGGSSHRKCAINQSEVRWLCQNSATLW